MAKKKILIIAGPNGAGKTTFAQEFLTKEAECPVFINADLIAAGLSPFQPGVAVIKAGRLMLQEIKAYAKRGDSFAFETTLSGRTYIKMIRDWRKQGYQIKLFYLSIKSPEEAIARIKSRVAQGGHNIPATIVRRRFASSLHNFKSIYKYEVDAWQWYDNSGDNFQLINQGDNL